MQRITLFFSAILLFTGTLSAQQTKVPIYAHLSLGYGNTFFYGSLAEKETINDGRGFGRNQGNTLTTWFYAAPEKWKGRGRHRLGRKPTFPKQPRQHQFRLFILKGNKYP